MSSTTAAQVIRVFKDYFSRWGLSRVVVTDNGPPFNSYEVAKFLSDDGVNYLTIPPNHPQSNGPAESAVGTIKDKLTKAVEDGYTLVNATCRFLSDYHNAVHSSTRKTPTELHVNRRLYTRFDVLTRNKKMSREVLLREYRIKQQKWSSGNVVGEEGNVIVEVEREDGSIARRHRDQIFPMTLLSNESTKEGSKLPEPEVIAAPAEELRRSKRNRVPVQRFGFDQDGNVFFFFR